MFILVKEVPLKNKFVSLLSVNRINSPTNCLSVFDHFVGLVL